MKNWPIQKKKKVDF